MKKTGVFILIILLTINILPFTLSETLSPPEIKETIDNYKDKIPASPEEAENQTQSYILQLWISFLSENKFFGKTIKTYESISPTTDPIIKVIIGASPAFSLEFLFTLIIWFTFLIMFWRILKEFSTFTSHTSFVISLGLSIILSITKVISLLVKIILSVISIFSIWWIKIIIIFLLLIGLLLTSIFSKSIANYIRKIKEKKAKEEEILNRLRLKNSVEVVEKFGKTIQDSLKDKP